MYVRAIAIASVRLSARSQPNICRHMRVLSARGDHPAHVLPSILAPVPHEKRMRAVIGIAAPVHLDVARVVGKFALVFLAQVKSIARFRQQAIKEFDVARVKIADRTGRSRDDG